MHVIRRLTIPHCARGPARCPRCAAERPCLALLDVDPPGESARPVIEIVIDGVTTSRCYEVVRRFESADEARACTRREGLDDGAIDDA